MALKGVVGITARHNVMGVGPMKEGTKLPPDQALGVAPTGDWESWEQLQSEVIVPTVAKEADKLGVSGGSGSVEQG